MEPIFENVRVDTEQLVQRAFCILMGKKYLIQFILSGICFLLAIGLYVLRREGVLLCAAVVYAFFLGRRIYQYTTYGKRALKKRLAYYDNMNPPMTNHFFEDRMVSQDIDSVDITPYNKISKVEFYSDLIMLYRKDGRVTVLDPYGFTKGDAQSFVWFIQSKTTPVNLIQER